MLGLAVNDLPHVNAALNALTTVSLMSGYYFIRNGMRQKHKGCMLSALFFSALFLVFYLTYHFNSGLAAFGGAGLIRPVYFSILILHVLGAVIITPMVPVTVYRALSGRFDAHRRLARWTFPLWMYVAVSGIVVYVMAIHLYPHAGGPNAVG
jgi:putative membrane protein